MKKKDWKICLFLSIAFLVPGLVAVFQLNIPPIIDEVGTLANSAYLVGYDWQETAYTMGGFYYKYGMSIFYAPFLKIIDDPYMVYKAMLAVNIVFFSTVPGIAYIIMKKHMKSSELKSALFGAAVGLLPSVFMFQTYAKSDAMLAFIPWTVLLVMLELNSTGKGKKKIILSILLSFLSVYAYAVHTRGLVVIIAVALTVILTAIFRRKFFVNLPAYLGSTAVFMLLDKWISSIFKSGVYGYYGTRHASAESFDFESLTKIFTVSGFKSFLKLTGGWLFSGLSNTFGLIGVAVIGGIVLFFVKRKAKKKAGIAKMEAAAKETMTAQKEVTETTAKAEIGETARTAESTEISGSALEEADNGNTAADEEIIDGNEKVFGFFSVLNLLGVYGMGLLFFFPVAHKYYLGISVSRSDRLIYERYIAAAFGPAMLFGLYLMFTVAKRYVKAMNAVKILTAVGFAAVIVFFKAFCVDYIQGVSGCVRYFLGISTFLEISGGVTNAAYSNLSRALMMAGMLGFGTYIVLAVFSWIKCEAKIKLLLVGELLIAVSIGIIFVVFENARYTRDGLLVKWTKQPVNLLISVSERDESFLEYPVMLDPSAKNIKHYQFQLKEFRVGSYKTAMSIEDNFFIIAAKGTFIEEYFDDDYYVFDSFSYKKAKKDIVYIKGHKLAQALMDAGFKISKYKGELVKANIKTSRKYSPDKVYNKNAA